MIFFFFSEKCIYGYFLFKPLGKASFNSPKNPEKDNMFFTPFSFSNTSGRHKLQKVSPLNSEELENPLDLKSRGDNRSCLYPQLEGAVPEPADPWEGLEPALEHQESFDFSFPTSSTNTSPGMQLKRRNDNAGRSPVPEGMKGSTSSAGRRRRRREVLRVSPPAPQPTTAHAAPLGVLCCRAEPRDALG